MRTLSAFGAVYTLSDEEWNKACKTLNDLKARGLKPAETLGYLVTIREYDVTTATAILAEWGRIQQPE